MSEENNEKKPLEQGWRELPDEHLPSPTPAPFFLALGVSWMFWGLVTSYIMAGIGFIIFLVALCAWGKEMIDEQH